MCDFNTLRNLLIALLAMTGWAVSSAWYAYGVTGVPIYGAVIWGITVIATIATIAMLFVCLGAAFAFCRCVAGVKACTTACSQLPWAILAAVLPFFFVLGVAHSAGADPNTLAILFLVTAAVATLSIYVGSLMVRLGSCQASG